MGEILTGTKTVISNNIQTFVFCICLDPIDFYETFHKSQLMYIMLVFFSHICMIFCYITYDWKQILNHTAHVG